MDSVKQWVGATAVVCLALMAAAWFLLVSPARATAADLRAQTEGQLVTNATLRAQLRLLQQQAEELPSQVALLERITAKVPSDAAYPDLVRALDELALDTGVELVSISPGIPGGTAVAPAPAAPAAEGAAVAPSPGGAGGAPVWSTMPLTLNAVGGFSDVQAFLAGLEELTRAVRVTALHLAPGANPVEPPSTTPSVEDGSSLAATITAEAYVQETT